MAYPKENKKNRDWSFIIPIIISIIILIIDIIRLRVGWDISQGNGPPIISYIRIISEALFDAYIPIVIYSLYLYFSSNRSGRKRSKLSQKYIPLTIIASVLCVSFFIIDACLGNEMISWLFIVVMILYVLLFHFFMYGRNVSI